MGACVVCETTKIIGDVPQFLDGLLDVFLSLDHCLLVALEESSVEKARRYSHNSLHMCIQLVAKLAYLPSIKDFRRIQAAELGGSVHQRIVACFHCCWS